MRVPRALIAVAVAGLLGLGCPCPSGPEVVHLRSVQLLGGGEGARALDEAGLDGASVEDEVRTALGSAGFQLGDGRCPHAVGVEVTTLRISPGAGVGPRAEIALEIVLRPAEEGPRPRSEVGAASVPISAFGGPRDAWRRALSDASRRAATGLAAALRAEAKSVEALVVDLGAKEPRVREEAVRVLGERRSRAAVPALIGRLGKEEPRIGHRVVGALAQIGDERAVPALIELSRATDAGLTSRLLPFIGDIGGPEAEGYLLTLSSGHPDPSVRKLAEEALAVIAQRAKDAPVATRSAKMPAP